MEITLRTKVGTRVDADMIRSRIEQTCDFLGIGERSVMIHDAEETAHTREVLALARELHHVRCWNGCTAAPSFVDYEKARRALRAVIA